MMYNNCGGWTQVKCKQPVLFENWLRFNIGIVVVVVVFAATNFFFFERDKNHKTK